MDGLLHRGWLETLPTSPDSPRLSYSPTTSGADAFAERGVVFPAAKSGKPVAFSCLDWTERRWHLGGPLGRAIVAALADAGCIERTPGSRMVTLKDSLDRWLDMEVASRPFLPDKACDISRKSTTN